MIEVKEKKEQTEERFIEELNKVKREGTEQLIEEMRKGGFFSAPCSGAYHLSEQGGLLIHSLNVLDYSRKLNEAFGNPIEDEAIIISALLHDLGKMGDHGKPNYIENILKGGKRSEAKPYETNKELPYFPHEVRSVMIAERYIALT
jgi:23S rRNA maturation-related 3'-5' exoribonuclease YhaM